MTVRKRFTFLPSRTPLKYGFQGNQYYRCNVKVYTLVIRGKNTYPVRGKENCLAYDPESMLFYRINLNSRTILEQLFKDFIIARP